MPARLWLLRAQARRAASGRVHLPHGLDDTAPRFGSRPNAVHLSLSVVSTRRIEPVQSKSKRQIVLAGRFEFYSDAAGKFGREGGPGAI